MEYDPRKKPFAGSSLGQFMDISKEVDKAYKNSTPGYKIDPTKLPTRFKESTASQTLQGGEGNVGSSVGSAVQSGTGVAAKAPALGQTQQQMLDEQNLGFAPTVNEATSAARINVPELPTLGEYGPTPVDAPRSTEPTRVGDVAPTAGGTVNTYTAPDYESAITALQDLRQARLNTGRLQEDRPVTTIGGYKSYAEDLAAFQSGDVRSEGYNRIRNERMQLKSQITDATRGISGNKAKAAIIEKMLSDYSATQKERLGQEAETAQAGMAAQAKMAEAQYDAASSAADRQQRAAETAAKLGIDQAELKRKQEADQAEQQARRERLGFDVAKSMQESELAQSKLGLQEKDLFRKSYEAGQSAQARDAGLRIKQFNAELELYKDATGEVPEEIKMKLAKKYGFTE